MNQDDFFNSQRIVFIQMDSTTFYQLVRQVYERLSEENKKEADSDFIGEKEAMKLLEISSKSTLQKYRDHSCFTFYKLSGRKILYSKKSIESYIRNNKESF